LRSLVTGASGFIGSCLVESLASAGGSVVALDIAAPAGSDVERPGHSQVENIRIDLANRDKCVDLAEALSRGEPFDELWHLAANSSIPAGMAEIAVDLNATFLTTVQAVELARQLHIPRFYFTSSSAVYGERRGRIEEDSGPLAPISNYGAMKMASEAVISAATAAFLERGVIIRLPNVAGPGVTHGLFYDLLEKLRSDPAQIETLGDGTQTKPYMHVREVVEAMLFLRDRSQAKLGVYNLGPEDDGIAIGRIVRLLLEAFNSSAVIRHRGGDRGWPGDIPRYSYSIARIKALGWRPRLSSEQAVRLACAELAEQVRIKPDDQLAEAHS
jgi:UDP-glucose 4-epimerase